eukprot:m.1051 g.1051  ORF g.1051 m.1051 type:complete len:53 (-) comp1003_c0_seq1:358-516(-)
MECTAKKGIGLKKIFPNKESLFVRSSLMGDLSNLLLISSNFILSLYSQFQLT